MKAKTVKEVLIAARWIIENVGWTQGTYARYIDPNTVVSLHRIVSTEGLESVCALGAVHAVEVKTSSHLLQRTMNVLRQAVRNNTSFTTISDWNDDPARTRKEVLAFFDKVIESTNE